MDNPRFVTHDECETYRKELKDELRGHDIRLTVLETNVKTVISLSKLILGAVLASGGTILTALLLK